MKQQVYSFDIFDTCLIRTLARPTDLFYLLFAQLIPNHPEILSELVKHRINSEVIARQSHPHKEDIQITDIYQQFTHPAINIDKTQLIELELTTESKYLRPIQPIKQQIEQLKQQGNRVIFISDMYLSTSFIQNCLINHGIATATDIVYVSGDIGLRKGTGNLFKYVLAKENIQPEQLYHTGDNPHTDIIIPEQLGISTTHFPHSYLNQYEKIIVNQSISPVEIRSQIAGISRAVRLKYNPESQNLAGLAANIIAPLLTSYVAWVIQDANKKGIEKLYFVSRDGQILFKIAQKLGKYITTPQCYYLYGSRQAWFLPSITTVNRDSLDWLILEGQSTAPKSLFKKLGIEIEEIEHLLKYNPEQQLNQQQIEEFWQIIQTEEISTIILERAKQARDLTIKYLQQEGITNSIKWAIVDIGWTLKSQRSLKRILSEYQQQDNLEGYYFGVRCNSLTTAEAGKYNAFLLEDCHPGQPVSTTTSIFNYQNIIEQVFTIADHPTVLTYQEINQQILPVFQQQKLSLERQIFVQEIHQIILSYVQEIAQTNILESHLEELKKYAITNTITYLNNPQEQYIKPIAKLMVGDDQNESRQRPIAREMQFSELFYFAFRFLEIGDRREFSQGFEWKQGSAVISSPIIQLIFKLFNLAEQINSNQQSITYQKVKFYLKNILVSLKKIKP